MKRRKAASAQLWAIGGLSGFGTVIAYRVV